MIEVAALLSAAAGTLAAVVGSLVKISLAKRKEDGHLRFEIQGGKSVDVPDARDITSLQKRVDALANISPRLAILDGWTLISRAILQRAKQTPNQEFDASQNLVHIAGKIPGISQDTIVRLDQLRKARNLVAHGAENLENTSLREAVQLIVPIIKDIGLPSQVRLDERNEA